MTGIRLPWSERSSLPQGALDAHETANTEKH